MPGEVRASLNIRCHRIPLPFLPVFLKITTADSMNVRIHPGGRKMSAHIHLVFDG